jgi:hypothetical protein
MNQQEKGNYISFNTASVAQRIKGMEKMLRTTTPIAAA